METKNLVDFLVIGGGAAGYFSALRYAFLQPSHQVVILEKGNATLQKVKISGGGRCNVTHGCFDPRELVQHYPRGNKELIGPFNTFACGDMMAWLDERGVELKIEDDGRVFPTTNSSQTIIDCFENEREKLKIKLHKAGALSIQQSDEGFLVQTTASVYQTKKLLVATGSSKQMWQHLESIGVKIVPPVPSLFTFNIKHPLLKDLPGLSFPDATIELEKNQLDSFGPTLITHWGLSGPCVLKLSAWGARELHKRNYKFNIYLSWLGLSSDQVQESIQEYKQTNGKLKVENRSPFDLPKRFWKRVCEVSNVQGNWADLSNNSLQNMVDLLSRCEMNVEGKSTFKDEFVTSGGIDKKEIDFRTMQHKQLEGLYFAGEVIDIDAITGGFNFQSAWTTAWIAAENAASS